MSASMPMPGGWSMSMAWMRMPGQTRAAAFAMFVAMWTVMMIAMMLPAIAPAVRSFGAAAGYFAVWAAIGIAIYPFGVAFATAAMRSTSIARAAPVLAGVVFVAAGIVQCTPWKARQLDCCRMRCDPALRDGVRLGIRCAVCCLPFMSAFLAAGVMNLAAMALATAAIAIERLVPQPQRVSRVIGAALIVAGGAFWI